ncbi:hypothetical protein BCR42DRAFT_409693 [Absidia repens]|uniref:UBX domain-containing protein n=1 Tax=Absidia repens TaxID=90262 RepID=A0A1X2IN00_9FUNG|nr:hypothetical protein BCR42DRAFT_409693 [Absidia repens]
MENDNDTNIAQFCAVTSATPQVAREFLQFADNSVDLAITLYLENGGTSLTSSAQQDSTRTAAARDEPNNSNSASDSEVISDEALARQLQEQEDARRQRPERPPPASDVRAPIAARTEILAGGHDGGDGGFLRMGASYRPVSSSSSSNDDSNAPSPATVAATAKAKRLADLFRPPFDIMFRGGFEDARASAREQNKWLLVNVQDPTEFACQVLNRDLWSDGFVKDIVRESFVFLQYGNESAEGKRYLTLYPVQHYPHVAIIDSRTGELAKSWEKQLSPSDFMMEVTEFLEQHSPEAAKSVTMKKPRQNLSDMSEEEQLQAAIAASTSDNNYNHTITTTTSTSTSTYSSTNQSPAMDDQHHKMASDGDGVESEQVPATEDESNPTSVLDSILPVERPETTDMAHSTRIQFRLADGSRVIRRFLKSDPVRYLFEFIKWKVPETKGQTFELVFNRQQLIDVLDQDIQEAGLQNAAVNVQFA